MRFPLTILLLAAAAAACSRTGDVREYELSGQVLAVRPERHEIVIRHDDIKGFMPGMTMPFRVRDRKWLDAALPGDIVNARLTLDDDGPYLSEVHRTGRKAPLPAGSEAPGVADLPVVEGQALPDVHLVDQGGKPFTLREMRGSPFAITFTYTRCPLPTYCPAQDRRFADLQQAIRRTPALAGARLLSITIDPEYDRPEVLAKHAERLGADPAVWRLATGERPAILAFASSLALSVIVEEPGSTDLVHSMRTAVVDKEGRLVRRYDGTAWRVSDVLRDLEDAS